MGVLPPTGAHRDPSRSRFGNRGGVDYQLVTLAVADICNSLIDREVRSVEHIQHSVEQSGIQRVEQSWNNAGCRVVL